MNVVTSNIFSSFQVKNESHLDFVHFKNKIFAEYNLIYYINDGYSINELSEFSCKHQLFFQKVISKVMQINLMIVDDIFPVIFADLALEVFLNKISSFHEYAVSELKLKVNNIKPYNDYLEYKFKKFIYYLIFSNISSEEVCNGIVDRNKIYYLKNKNKEIEYYSIYEQNELQDLLCKKMVLEINFENSYIKKDIVNICLQIKF